MVNIGDTVLLPEYGGSKVVLHDDQELFIYRDDDIMGTLHDPVKWFNSCWNKLAIYSLKVLLSVSTHQEIISKFEIYHIQWFHLNEMKCILNLW